MASPDADAAMRAAMTAHKAGRLAEAEEGYRAVLRSKPTDPKAFYYLSLLHFHRDDTTAALEYMRQCLRYAPNHPHAWNSLGAMLIAQGSRSEAKQAYRRVTETAPNRGEGWYNLGICLRDEGDMDGAIDCLRTSIAREPGYSRAYEALATLLYQLERVPEAAAVYSDWASRDPANPIARHMATATSRTDTPARAADEYVRKLFDDSANTFDSDLRKLDYRAPALVAAALAERARGEALPHVLDAGCGTGLCGPLVREHCQKLWGVDLSPRMIDLARARGCYDELIVAELCAFMRSRPAGLDAIVSADTLVYFGDLAEPLGAAREALRPGGVFIFTLESPPEETSEDFRLEVHGRYSHRESYVRRVLATHGFNCQALANAVLRKERDTDVASLLVVAQAGPT
jgi:predicted TPR repeat methyltransferase